MQISLKFQDKYAEIGHDVVGLDVDEDKVSRLARGEAPFHEPGFPEILARGIAAGRLGFTTDPGRLADADLVFIGVGTPQLAGKLGANLSQVDAAVETVVEHINPRPDSSVLMAGKSTVPVGTAQRLTERLKTSGKNFLLAWNPERSNPFAKKLRHLFYQHPNQRIFSLH